MAVDASSLIIPSRGLVFKGPVDATPPLASALAAITPTSTPLGVSGVCLGHLSRENLPAYSKDGGDITSYGSWWLDAIDSTVDPTNWTLTINALQSDATNLGLAFGGGTLNTTDGFFDIGTVSQTACSLLVLMVGGDKRKAFYHPNTLTSIGDAPELAVDAYLEIQLQASLLASPTTGKFWRVIDPSLVVTP